MNPEPTSRVVRQVRSIGCAFCGNDITDDEIFNVRLLHGAQVANYFGHGRCIRAALDTPGRVLFDDDFPNVRNE